MPLYEYECTQCRRHTEKIQKFSDPEITTCPHCGGPLQRVLSAPAFALKGGGWYADGYGSKKPAGGSDAKSEGGKPDSSVSTSSDSGSSSSDSSKSATPAPAAAESKPATPAPASTPAKS